MKEVNVLEAWLLNLSCCGRGKLCPELAKADRDDNSCSSPFDILEHIETGKARFT